MEQTEAGSVFGYVRLESPGADSRQTLLDDYQANYINDFWLAANPFDGNNSTAPFANLNEFTGLFPQNQQQFALTTRPYIESHQPMPAAQPMHVLPSQPLQPTVHVPAERRPSLISQLSPVQSSPISPTAARRGSNFSFGTDPNFAPGCFRPANSTPSHVQVQKRLEANTKNAIKFSNSSTRQASPDHEQVSPNQGSRPSTASSDDDRPRQKRARILDPGSATSNKIRGARVDNQGRRRNLTEDEKRKNHIDSEQKRRTFAKTHFTILNETIPALVGHKNPKAKTLGETHTYLVSLLKGNEELRALLKDAKPV